MEARHRGLRSSGTIAPDLLVRIEDPAEYHESHHHCPTPSKERRVYTRTTWMSLIISVLILLTIAIIIVLRLDVVHNALWKSSGYENNLHEFGSTMGYARQTTSQAPSTEHRKVQSSSEHLDNKLRQAMLKGKDVLSTKTRPPVSSGQNLRINEIESLTAEHPTDLNLPDLVNIQIAKVKHMKHDLHLVMEKDPAALVEISLLQQLCRQYVPSRFGAEPYVIEMKLQFPETMSDPALGNEASILFTLAPLQYMPYSVLYFLTLAESFKSGAFHRKAGHVLQSMVNANVGPLAFQEYHPSYPHVKNTLGFAGRPGGPEFYISILDNSEIHGPASQGSSTEADTCFGRITEGLDVVDRMKKQPGAKGPAGFISGQENYIKITSLKLVRY